MTAPTPPDATGGCGAQLGAVVFLMLGTIAAFGIGYLVYAGLLDLLGPDWRAAAIGCAMIDGGLVLVAANSLSRRVLRRPMFDTLDWLAHIP